MRCKESEMRKTENYTCSVTWSDEDHEYVGLCAEFPYLSYLAPSPDDALEGVREAVTFALGMFAEDSTRPPRPRQNTARPPRTYA